MSEWLRVQGIGRERFGSQLESFLKELGFETTSADEPEGGHRVEARLRRQNPAVPASMRELTFRLRPTGGGALLAWESPTAVAADENGRIDRFVRELRLHLERTVRTESHGTAKVIAPERGALPWASAPAGGRLA